MYLLKSIKPAGQRQKDLIFIVIRGSLKKAFLARTFQPNKDPLLSNTESLKAQSLHPRYVYRLLEMIFYMPPNCSASYMTDTHFRGKT